MQQSARMAPSIDEPSSYYLQLATKELADDLNKLREAPDFKPDSVALLIHTIRQGSTLFHTKASNGDSSSHAPGLGMNKSFPTKTSQ